MSPTKRQATRRYTTRDKLVAVAAALGVVVVTALAIFLMKPGDSEPDVTDLPPSIPELPDTGQPPEDPLSTAPVDSTAPEPAPTPEQSTDPSPPSS